MDQKTVLVVEDSPELAESLRDILELEGYRALVTNSGREGISLALQEHPDLILLDIRLPDIDGYQVYEEVQKDAWGKTAKVTILTASESLENISRNISLPIEHVLFKPDLSIKELLTKIQARLAE